MKDLSLWLLIGLSLVNVHSAWGQQPAYRIVSVNTSDQFVDSFNGFRSRMRELGYKDGKEIRYDLYNTGGDNERLKRVANQILRQKIDLIVTSSTTATVAVAKATAGTKIPVVFLSAGNPQKLVKSFAGSGTNVTGISSGTVELTGKRFELLRELVPAAKRVARFLNPRGVNFRSSQPQVETAAKKLGFTLINLAVIDQKEIVALLPGLTAGKVDAVFTPPDALVTAGIDVIVARSLVEKLPVVTSLLDNVRRGCLATYAANYFDLGRQGAAMVDKILKGAKPGDLPIEQPTSFSLVINLKTAKAIGLKVPASILVRANEVIE